MKSPIQEIVPTIIKALEKQYGVPKKSEEKLPLLDIFVQHFVEEQEKLEHATKAYKSLKEEFVDWNEVRVSQSREIFEVLIRHIKDKPQEKANQIREMLSIVFHQFNKMNIDFLWEQKFSEIRDFINQVNGVELAILPKIILNSPTTDKLPLLLPTLRVGERIGLWSKSTTQETVHELLEKHCKSKQIYILHYLLYTHGESHCTDKNYACSGCSLSKICNVGQKELAKTSKNTKATKKTKKAKETAAKEKKSVAKKESHKKSKDTKKSVTKVSAADKKISKQKATAETKAKSTKKTKLTTSKTEKKNKKNKSEDKGKKAVSKKASSSTAKSCRKK